MKSHQWNRDPLAKPPRKYRLTVEHPALTAEASHMPMLLDLNQQLDALGYEFVKLEKVTDA